MKSPPPRELTRADTVRDEKWLFGRLLFRSPSILGEKAVRIGLSCNSCHANGHKNPDFYIEGLSDSPGRIDVTHRFWQAGFDDGISNPIDIPSLRGARDSAPYGTVNIFPDLHGFIRHVIEKEFAGPPPEPKIISALAAYIESLETDEIAGITSGEIHGDMNYLSLLRSPIEKRDFTQLDNLIDLIRSDYGRQVSLASTPTGSVRQKISLLRALRAKAAAKDYVSARTIYEKLTNAQ